LKEIKLDKTSVFWIMHITGWLLFALFMRLYEEGDFFLSLKRSLLFLLTYLIGFLLTLGLRYFYRIIYDRINSLILILIIIIMASAIALIIWEPVDVLISAPFWDEGELEEFLTTYSPFTLGRYYRMNLFWFMFILMWSILYFGIKNWYEHMEQRIKAEKAMKLANNAQLIMLRYQLNPHFLFNSLNSIKALTYENPEQAGYMLTEFSEFLRLTLNYNSRLYITIREEIDIIEKFLLIEKIRFEEKLRYTVRFDEVLLDREILGFITQPLVENAIKHGFRTSPAGIVVNIAFSAIEDYCKIIIENTGILDDDKASGGTGLKNVIERLDNAYSRKYSLNISQEEGVVRLTLLIPDGK
jgi:two-component system, LytTR family, sensor kinase